MPPAGKLVASARRVGGGRLLGKEGLHKLATVVMSESIPSGVSSDPSFGQLNLVRIEVSVRLLAIEDEPKLGQLIVSSLTQAGFAVDWSQTLSEGKEFVTANSYDLILLDMRLPDGNGLDFLRVLRRSQNNVPVIILSAADTVDDRVIGLTEGADDYIVKPFASPELVARIRVALRRPGAALGIDRRSEKPALDGLPALLSPLFHGFHGSRRNLPRPGYARTHGVNGALGQHVAVPQGRGALGRVPAH